MAKLKLPRALTKQGIKEGLGMVVAAGKAHEPEILTVFGIGCYGIAMVSAWKDAPEAKEALKKLKEEYGEKIPPKIFVKVMGPYFLKSALFFALGTTCEIKSLDVSLKRNAALAATVELAKDRIDDLEKFKDEAKKELGVEKSDEVEKTIAQEEYNSDPDDFTSAHMISAYGNDRFIDSVTGQKFIGRKDDVYHAVNQIGRDMNLDALSAVMNIGKGTFKDFIEEYMHGDYINIGSDSGWDWFGWSTEEDIPSVNFVPVECQDGKMAYKIMYHPEPGFHRR